MKATNRFLAMLPRLATIVFCCLGFSFPERAEGHIADDWKYYYKYAGRSPASLYLGLAWKYKTKLIFDVMNNIGLSKLPVRTTRNAKAFSVIVWSVQDIDIHAGKPSQSPPVHWTCSQEELREKVLMHLQIQGIEMSRQYFDPGGIKAIKRCTFEWREGDCIVRLTEFARVQTTLAYYDITDRKETDFRFLEAGVNDLDSSDPLITAKNYQ